MNRSLWQGSTEAHTSPLTQKLSRRFASVGNDAVVVSTVRSASERMNSFPFSSRDDSMISQRRNAHHKITRAAGQSDKFDDITGQREDFPLLSTRKLFLTAEEQNNRDGSHTKVSDLRRISNGDGIPRRGVSHSPKPPSSRRRIGSKRVKHPLRSKSVDNVHDDHMLEQNTESISDLTNLFAENVFVNDERQNLSFSSDYSNRRMNSSYSSDASRRRYERQNSSFSSDVSNIQYDRLQNSFSSTGSYRNIQHETEPEQNFDDVPIFEQSSNFEAIPGPPGRLRISSRDTPSKRTLLRQVSAGTSSSRDFSRSTLLTNKSSSESKSSLGSYDFDQDCLYQGQLIRNKSSDGADRTSTFSFVESNAVKTARRSRRPKLSSNDVSSEAQQPFLQSASEKLPARHTRKKNREENRNGGKMKEDYLNRSFNLSFSSVNDLPNVARNEAGNDVTFLTPSLNPKPYLSSILNFEIPSESLKVSRHAIPPEDVIQPIQDAFSIVDEEGSLALDEVSEAKLSLYEYARRYEWEMVLDECKHSPWTAKHVSNEDGTTALHLAVMSRANPQIRDGTQDGLKAASLYVIEQLIIACPESAIIRCTQKKYTPLCFACLVTDKGYDMEDSANIIQIILKHSPHCALVFTDECFSALDVHIISYSRLFQEKEEVHSRNGRSSTVVLRTLLQACPSLALSRSYGNRVRGPVELLYRCNLNEFKDASGQEIAVFGKHKKKSETCSVLSTLSQWWAWKWTLILLEVSSHVEADDAVVEEATSFLAVHAASQLEGCPVPILALAIDAFPDQVKMRNPHKGLNNCPLHYVCGWVSDALCISGDPVIVKRKRKAIALLLEAFPKAARMTNNLGETPLHLAIETCSSWETLEDLVRMFPAALTIPRNIDNCQEDSPLFKAMAYHNEDLGSVGSDEWEPDAIETIQGMYPFMIAAVLSLVPDRRMHGSSIILDYSKNRDNAGKGLQQKDLESLRSIYGLLRAKPLALELFRDDEKSRILVSSGDKVDERDDTDENTEAYLEENISDYTEEDVSIEIQSEYTEEEVE